MTEDTMTQDRTTGGWQLDQEGAWAYERNLVPAFMDAWAADLIGAVEPGPGQRVLDVACGTGIVARHAARRVGPEGEVVGTDLNPAMLAVAGQVAGGLEPTIRWKQAPADALPVADASFDVTLCQCALQFFPDPGTALAEMARATRPGGRVGLSTCRSLDHQPGYRVLVDALTEHVGVEAGRVIASPYGLGEPDVLRGLLTDASLGEIHLRYLVSEFRIGSAEAFLRVETTSSPLGDLLGSLDRDVRTALVDDLGERLAPHTDDDGVVFPFETVVVTAVRPG